MAVPQNVADTWNVEVVELTTKYSVDATIPVGRAPVVVKYILLPSASQCDDIVTTHGEAIVMVAVPIDVAA